MKRFMVIFLKVLTVLVGILILPTTNILTQLILHKVVIESFIDIIVVAGLVVVQFTIFMQLIKVVAFIIEKLEDEDE